MEKLELLLPLAWRSLWRNPRRTIITVLVVSVGLWSILVFAVLLEAWSASSRDTTQKMMTGEGQIHAAGYLDDPTIANRMAPLEGALADILKSDAVKAYAERVRVAAIMQSEYRTLPITLTGVAPAKERAVSVLPDKVSKGRYLENAEDDGIVIGRNLASRLKTRVGKRVVVLVQDTKGELAERAFKVVGVYAASQQIEDEFVFTGLDPAQKLIGAGSGISEIVFDSSDAEALPSLVDKLRAAAPALDVQSWETLKPLAYAVSTFFNEFIMMWLGVMFAMMAIGIVNTQLMAVFERTREFGLFQALGMRPRLVLMEVALESTMLIGIGVVIGAAFAVLSVMAFPGGLDLGFLGRGAELVGAGRVLYLSIDISDFVRYSFIIWALGVCASLWPAWRAAHVSPVMAMARA
ncbi:ABC transporter permease [Hyphococcus luteus]|uniref:ABC transporter permease n=1 Tax=Hyphococcus luteus TaxID=2058213 RepID=A0A2S7K0D3_9PROT|nr:ABC transporter permease [Marinicaulis flavus]PQA85964.1 ABC transporter permease [Marinicaulis flavus]